MDKQDDFVFHVPYGPRKVLVPMVPSLSDELKDQLSIWEPVAVDALLILQEKAPEKSGELYLANKTIQKKQMNIGTGWVIGKCRDKNHIDERLNDLNIGDRVKFPAGVTISAEFPQSVPEHLRVQILHLQNLLMITRCGDPDSSSSILGFGSKAETMDVAMLAACLKSSIEPDSPGHYKGPVAVDKKPLSDENS